MQIHYLDPSKRNAFEGFMNYKLSKSDGDNESSGGNHGDGCFTYIFMGIILILLAIIFQ